MRTIICLALMVLVGMIFTGCSANSQSPSGGITTSSGAGTGGTVTTGTAAPTGGTTTSTPTGPTGSGTTGKTGEVIPRDQESAGSSATGGVTQEDAHLADVVRASLKNAGILPRYNINVSASNGIITLQGTVPDRTTENSILDQVKKVEGVKDVQSRLNLESK